MTIYTCEDSFEAMMTCIYDAWASRRGHANVKLQLEPVEQAEMFCEYVHVEADPFKAEKVTRSVQKKISYEAYRQMYLASTSYREDKLDAIYRFLILGFAAGRKVTAMLSCSEVTHMMELSRKAEREANYFREFTRFTSLDGRIYVAHIEPKCNVTSIAAGHFADRFPSESWMLIDDNRRIAAVHPHDQSFYMTTFSEKEMKWLKETDNRRDVYTDLWKEFFRSVSIEARANPKCQRTLMPLWYRKHAVEFT